MTALIRRDHGRAFETHIALALTALQKRRLLIFEQHPANIRIARNPKTDTVFPLPAAKTGFDFFGILLPHAAAQLSPSMFICDLNSPFAIPFCIETKSTILRFTRLANPRAVAPHQLTTLIQWGRAGALSLLLIEYRALNLTIAWPWWTLSGPDGRPANLKPLFPHHGLIAGPCQSPDLRKVFAQYLNSIPPIRVNSACPPQADPSAIKSSSPADPSAKGGPHDAHQPQPPLATTRKGNRPLTVGQLPKQPTPRKPPGQAKGPSPTSPTPPLSQNPQTKGQ